MYSVEVNNNKIKAWVHWGDKFPFTMDLYEDDGVTLKDMTGKTCILGIDKGNSTKLEITGVVNVNQVVFNIDPDVYIDVLEEGGKYKFDWWNATDEETMIYQSDIEFRKVSHEVA